MLEYPVQYFSSSARLNARLAAAELADADIDSASALLHAQRAV